MKDILVSLVLLLLVIAICNSYDSSSFDGWSSRRLTLGGLEDRVDTFDVVPQPGEL